MKNQIAITALRNIVSAWAETDAKNILLKGEIPVDFTPKSYFKNGSMGESKDTYKVFGWSPEVGFVIIEECVGEDTINIAGKPLFECDNVDKYPFFIVHNYGHNSWEGCNQEAWDTWTLYKAPNFKEFWDKVELDDIERWTQFINA